jgi:hypothetical protein
VVIDPFKKGYQSRTNVVKDEKVASLKIFTAINIQVIVFWVMTLYSGVVVYQCFEEPCCLHLHPSTLLG